LTLSRNRPPNPQRIDLVDTVAQLIRMVTRVVGEDVAVEWIPDAASWGVVADPSQVAQVMLNLVINARDAMPDGGRLTIETANVDLDEGWVRTHLGSAAGPHVMLAVTDTGVGMDAATLERVFEPFFTTKDHGKGTGLGLSIVYGIVQQSNGHVWVYSEPGHGTSVKIFLPRADGPLTPAGGPSPIPRGGEERVLVVEDDDQVRAVAVGILQRHGYRVTAARTPAEAIDWFERDPTAFDLLLTDVIMPGLTGRELAAHLHTVRPTLRVLFMSGYTDNTFRTVPAAGTSTPLLQKPLTPSTLLRSVRDALER
ncbi:MAG: ATP-binding protein, partial [Myxococcota bacterium]